MSSVFYIALAFYSVAIAGFQLARMGEGNVLPFSTGHLSVPEQVIMAIYLDNSATTAVRQEVVDAMLPFLTRDFGNPSSIHSLGARSAKALDLAREQAASLLSCSPEEIYFSACGTMSNNVAIMGRARFIEANDGGRHLITSQIEHPAVLGPCKFLESRGWKVTYLPVDGEGFVNVSDLEAAITPETSIISVMWANNEIGTIEPISAIAEIGRSKGIFVHSDAVQAAGKDVIDVSSTPVSSLALSGHKFYAPKGIGILYVRKGDNVMPTVFGGGQEQGLIPGTEGIANIVAIGKSAELALTELQSTIAHLKEMQTIVWNSLKTLENVRLTGPADMARRIPGHISVAVRDGQGEAMVMKADLEGICVSSGSACHKGIIEPSNVLRAIRLGEREIMGSVRISAGRFNTKEECSKAAGTLASIFGSAVPASEKVGAEHK